MVGLDVQPARCCHPCAPRIKFPSSTLGSRLFFRDGSSAAPLNPQGPFFLRCKPPCHYPEGYLPWCQTQDKWLEESVDLSMVQPYNQVLSHGDNTWGGRLGLWVPLQSPLAHGRCKQGDRESLGTAQLHPSAPGTLPEGGCDPAAERPVRHKAGAEVPAPFPFPGCLLGAVEGSRDLVVSPSLGKHHNSPTTTRIGACLAT